MIELLRKIRLPSFDSVAILGLAFTIIGTYYSVFDWLEADLKGKWNTNKAFQIIAQEVQNKSDLLKGSECKNNDCLIKKLTLTEFTPDQQTVLIAVETNQGDEEVTRHTPAVISLFEFKKNKFGWDLVLSDIESFLASNFGSLDEGDIEINYIGENMYGIFVSEVHPGIGGSNSSIINVYSRLKDSYVKVLSYYDNYTEVRYNYPGVPQKKGAREKYVNTKLKIIKNASSGFYDIEISVMEEISYHSKTGETSIEGNDNYTIKLHFNGKKYVQSIDEIDVENEDVTNVLIQEPEFPDESDSERIN